MNPSTKQVTIGPAEYQIAQMTAGDGSWILSQVLTKLLPVMVQGALDQMAGAKLPAGRALLSEEEFHNIQGHCLAVCRRIEKGIPMPVFVRPNTWAVKELEYDLLTVMALTIHALTFNLTPFFEEGGLSQLLALLPGLVSNSPDSPR